MDASALLALLKLEPGHEIVETHIRESRIGAVNFGEVAQRLMREGWSREQFETTADALNIAVIPIDANLAIDGAEIREIGRKAGLSQADCLCLALAKRKNATVLTADRAWMKMSEATGVTVRLIR